MPYFDSSKGGFVGTQALKKTLLASVPQNIAETTQQVKLAAELNTIFKQGGLTQELLAECERRRQLAAAEKEGKEEGTTESKEEKKVLFGKAVPTVGGTAGVAEASSSTTTVENSDSPVALESKKSATHAAIHSEGVKLDSVDNETSEAKIESGVPVPKDQTPKKKLEVSLGRYFVTLRDELAINIKPAQGAAVHQVKLQNRQPHHMFTIQTLSQPRRPH